jgi:hypothetical protein
LRTRKGFRFRRYVLVYYRRAARLKRRTMQEFFIPFEDAPKITISTNYVISDEGNHAKRRQKVLEFSNYFSPSHTPFDEFNRMLFTDWDGDEWNRFYNFMFFACQVYLEGGILETDQTDTNKLKNIKLKYSEDLLIYFNDFVSTERDYEPIKEIYNDFLLTYGLTAKEYPKDKFSKGLKYISSVLGYTYENTTKKIEKRAQVAIKITKIKK